MERLTRLEDAGLRQSKRGSTPDRGRSHSTFHYVHESGLTDRCHRKTDWRALTERANQVLGAAGLPKFSIAPIRSAGKPVEQVVPEQCAPPDLGEAFTSRAGRLFWSSEASVRVIATRFGRVCLPPGVEVPAHWL